MSANADSNFRQDIIFTLIRKGAITAAEIALLNDYEIEDVRDELSELRREGLVRVRARSEFLFPSDLWNEIEERRVLTMARQLGCDYECLDTWFVYCGGPVSRALSAA